MPRARAFHTMSDSDLKLRRLIERCVKVRDESMLTHRASNGVFTGTFEERILHGRGVCRQLDDDIDSRNAAKADAGGERSKDIIVLEQGIRTKAQELKKLIEQLRASFPKVSSLQSCCGWYHSSRSCTSATPSSPHVRLSSDLGLHRCMLSVTVHA